MYTIDTRLTLKLSPEVGPYIASLEYEHLLLNVQGYALLPKHQDHLKWESWSFRPGLLWPFHQD